MPKITIEAVDINRNGHRVMQITREDGTHFFGSGNGPYADPLFGELIYHEDYVMIGGYRKTVGQPGDRYIID